MIKLSLACALALSLLTPCASAQSSFLLPVASDDCSAATSIPGTGAFVFDPAGATTGVQGQTNTLCDQNGGAFIWNDVWFTWTAICTGSVVVETCGSVSWDSKIAVYDGSGCPTQPPLACNDDTCVAGSRVTFAALAGSTYLIQIGAYPGSTPQAGSIAIQCVGSPPLGSGECFGDTPAACPCTGAGGTGTSNPGASGHGCGSFAFPNGAALTAMGIAQESADNVVLTCTEMAGPGLFFQADANISALVFGDGSLCATVGIKRLGVVFPTLGTASYPGGLTPNPISVSGAPVMSPSGTKHYQVWYRDSTPNHCNPQTFNTSNGLVLTWVP